MLSIMGLGEGRWVILGLVFLRSASFSWSHCSAILPQSTAVWEVAFGVGVLWWREEDDDVGVEEEGRCPCPCDPCEDWGVLLGYWGVVIVCCWPRVGGVYE